MRCSGQIFNTTPILVESIEHRFLLAESAHSLDVVPQILLEPMRKDSCAAIVAGALLALERDNDCMIIMVAADHHIPDNVAFAGAVANAAATAMAGMLVTFGVKPIKPATGHGYILLGKLTSFGDIAHVARFVEKPSLPTASDYIKSGYLWNSGNFLFRAKSLIDEAKKYAAAVVEAVKMALGLADRDTDYIRL